MRPRLMANDPTYLRLLDPELLCDRRLAPAWPPLKLHDDRPHVRLGEFCVGVKLAVILWPVLPAAFPHRAIVVVFFLRTNVEMGRVHTGRVVAGMEDMLPLWDRSVVNLPREPMRFHPSLVPVQLAAVEEAIAVRITCANPLPALVWRTFADLVPKSSRRMRGGRRHLSIIPSLNPFKVDV